MKVHTVIKSRLRKPVAAFRKGKQRVPGALASVQRSVSALPQSTLTPPGRVRVRPALLGGVGSGSGWSSTHTTARSREAGREP